MKKLSRDQRFRNHPRNKDKAGGTDKKVRTIAGRLVRDVERKPGTGVDVYQNELDLYKRVLARKKNDKNKIYSLHEVDVRCISKGKEHKQYEFGNKVSITRTGIGVIVGAPGFRNEFDGHTPDKAIEQVERMAGRAPGNGICDRGYCGRGKSEVQSSTFPSPFPRL